MLRALGTFALAASIAACSDDPAGGAKSSDGGGGPTGSGGAGGATGAGGEGGAGGAPPAPTYCFSGSIDVSPMGSSHAVTTTRYHLLAETSESRAEEMGRLLEAGGAALDAWFGVDSPPTAPMEVRFFADQVAWQAALDAAGLSVDPSAGGYYDPNGGIAYLYDQPTRYFTHELLLHEAAHQYHHLARGGLLGQPAWYVEGIAEYLQRHDWDGSCVRIGVLPLFTQEDSPGQALADLSAQGVDLAGVVDGSVAASRPVLWAFLRYLQHGEGAKWAEGFGAFRDAMDDGTATDVLAAFTSAIAPPGDLEQPLASWLAADQEPMSVVYLEWTHVGPEAAIGESGAFSTVVTKAAVAHFEASFGTPASDPWAAGVMLGFDSPDDYTALVVTSAGRLSTFEMVAGSATWFDRGAAPPAKNGGYAVSVDHAAAGSVAITVNGRTTSLPNALPARAGLAVDGARVAFDGIAWRAK